MGASYDKATDYTKQLQFVQRLNDQTFGQIEIFRNEDGKFIMKNEKSFIRGDKRYDNFKSIIQYIHRTTNVNIIPFQHLEQQHQSNVCIEYEKIIIYCQYLNFTLKDLILKNKTLEEEQIWYCIKSLVELVEELERKGIYMKLMLDNVFLTLKGIPVVYLHHLSVDQRQKNTNVKSERKQQGVHNNDNSLINCHNQYLTPENLHQNMYFDILLIIISILRMQILSSQQFLSKELISQLLKQQFPCSRDTASNMNQHQGGNIQQMSMQCIIRKKIYQLIENVKCSQQLKLFIIKFVNVAVVHNAGIDYQTQSHQSQQSYSPHRSHQLHQPHQPNKPRQSSCGQVLIQELNRLSLQQKIIKISHQIRFNKFRYVLPDQQNNKIINNLTNNINNNLTGTINNNLNAFNSLKSSDANLLNNNNNNLNKNSRSINNIKQLSSLKFFQSQPQSVKNFKTNINTPVYRLRQQSQVNEDSNRKQIMQPNKFFSKNNNTNNSKPSRSIHNDIISRNKTSEKGFCKNKQNLSVSNLNNSSINKINKETINQAKNNEFRQDEISKSRGYSVTQISDCGQVKEQKKHHSRNKNEKLTLISRRNTSKSSMKLEDNKSIENKLEGNRKLESNNSECQQMKIKYHVEQNSSNPLLLNQQQCQNQSQKKYQKQSSSTSFSSSLLNQLKGNLNHNSLNNNLSNNSQSFENISNNNQSNTQSNTQKSNAQNNSLTPRNNINNIGKNSKISKSKFDTKIYSSSLHQQNSSKNNNNQVLLKNNNNNNSKIREILNNQLQSANIINTTNNSTVRNQIKHLLTNSINNISNSINTNTNTSANVNININSTSNNLSKNISNVNNNFTNKQKDKSYFKLISNNNHISNDNSNNNNFNNYFNQFEEKNQPKNGNLNNNFNKIKNIKIKNRQNGKIAQKKPYFTHQTEIDNQYQQSNQNQPYNKQSNQQLNHQANPSLKSELGSSQRSGQYSIPRDKASPISQKYKQSLKLTNQITKTAQFVNSLDKQHFLSLLQAKKSKNFIKQQQIFSKKTSILFESSRQITSHHIFPTQTYHNQSLQSPHCQEQMRCITTISKDLGIQNDIVKSKRMSNLKQIQVNQQSLIPTKDRNHLAENQSNGKVLRDILKDLKQKNSNEGKKTVSVNKKTYFDSKVSKSKNIVSVAKKSVKDMKDEDKQNQLVNNLNQKGKVGRLQY